MVDQGPLSFWYETDCRAASWLPPSASSGDRVLVVEEPGGRGQLTLGLEMAGYQVDVAHDGEAGLIVAAARIPAAAVIDLSIPVIDGWLLAESLRYVFGQHIRLIALASRDEPEGRERRRAAGVDAHVVKPVSPNRAHQTPAAAARSLTRRRSRRPPMAARKTCAPLLCARCRREILPWLGADRVACPDRRDSGPPCDQIVAVAIVAGEP